MNGQEWINLQEALYIIAGPVFVMAIPLAAVASLMAGVIGGLMSAFSQIRKS